MTTYADLIALKDADTIFTEIIDRLEQAGFPITAWQAGGVARTLADVDATTLAELYELVSEIGKGWSLDDAEDAWLTLHAYSRFDLTRIAATFAKHSVRLSTVASGAGPYSITAGQLVVTNSAGIRFRSTNSTTETVPASGYVDITVQAETAGVGGNTAPSSVVTPALAGVVFSWQSVVTAAIDEEGDPALRQRCRDRWATLAVGQGTQAAYRYWCVNAVDENDASCAITRIAFDTIPGDGSVPIWVSGASGNITNDQLADAQTYVDARKPLTDAPTLSHATEVTITITGTVTFKSGQNTSANQTLVLDEIAAYFAGLDISTADAPVVVDEAGIKAAIYNAVPGKVKDADISTSPSTDYTLPAGRVAKKDTSGIAWA